MDDTRDNYSSVLRAWGTQPSWLHSAHIDLSRHTLLDPQPIPLITPARVS